MKADRTAALALALTAVAATPALADVAETTPIAQVCAGHADQVISRERLAEEVLRATGVSVAEVFAEHPDALGSDYGRLAVAAVFAPKFAPEKTDAVRNLVVRLEQRLGEGSVVQKPGLTLVGGRRVGEGWLFDPARSWIITCGKGKAGSEVITDMEEPEARRAFVVRGKVAELGATGDDLETADAVNLGFKRVRAKKDGGGHKVATSETFDGVLAFQIGGIAQSAPVFVYGAYSLSRERARPQAPLDPGAAIDDDDTNAYEVGLSVNGLILKSTDRLSLVGDTQLAYVADDIKGSRRLKLAGALDIGLPIEPLMFCGFNGFKPVGDQGWRVRCRIRGEFEASHVLDAGKADFKQHGEFLGVGGSLRVDLATAIGVKDGVIASIGYRYLPTISGRAPDLHRFDTSLKYRLWLDSGLGVDLGLTYGKGRESKGYKIEDKLEAGIGVLF